MRVFYYLIIIFIIFASGCTMNSGEPVKVQQKEVHEGGSDILVIDQKYMIPESPIYPNGKDVLFTVVLKNTDEKKTLYNVYVDLYDDSVFTKEKQNRCTRNQPCTILPQSEETIDFTLKAPTKEDVANVKMNAKLKFLVGYTSVAATKMDILVVSLDELHSLMRSGKSIHPLLTKTYASGPVSILLDAIGDHDYVVEGLTTNVKVQLKNTGSYGEIKDSLVKPNMLRIVFPSGFSVYPPGSKNSNWFSVTGDIIGAITGYDTATTDITDTTDTTYTDTAIIGHNGDCLYDDCETGLHCEDNSYKYDENKHALVRDHEKLCCKSNENMVLNDDNNPKCAVDTCDFDESYDRRNDYGCVKRIGNIKSCADVGMFDVYDSRLTCPDNYICCSYINQLPPTPHKTPTRKEIPSISFRCQNNYCENLQDIMLLRGKSEEFVFSVKAPEIDIPYKTYPIYAQLRYDYEIHDSFDVTIEEFK